MVDYRQELMFGSFLTPTAASADRVVELARVSEAIGLDLVTIQDHPYQARFLDTWTVLSVIAAQTSSIRLAPNVANLPLRPPVVLARSVASLDLLSHGRVELGLGAGAFWDAIEAVGGRRLSPGEAVAALAEGIDVVRAVWDANSRAVRHRGEHYQVVGAHPGPAPAHAVEIWVGSYKPRMLALTGRQGDGWLPSMGYAAPDALPPLNAAIDAAAESAGRSPTEIRRLYNLNGSFGSGAGFLQGSAGDWAEQLAALTLDQGMSCYILSSDDPDVLRRFAEEVAPAVRMLVEGERSGPQRPEPPRDEAAVGSRAGRPANEAVAATPSTSALALRPTVDDGARRSPERLWDERDRPTGPAVDPDRRYTDHERATGQHLIDIHDALRAELTQLFDVIDQVARGQLDVGAARSHLNEMTMRQNNWTLGAFCESYCRIVTGHHTLEDRSVFPHLRRREPRLAPVLDRLQDEHEVIAAVLDRVDLALVALVAEPDGMAALQGAVDLLADVLLSHLSYEEHELVEPLARVGFY